MSLTATELIWKTNYYLTNVPYTISRIKNILNGLQGNFRCIELGPGVTTMVYNPLRKTASTRRVTLDMIYCVITKTCFVSVLSAKSLQNCVRKDMPDNHSFHWINSEMGLPKSSLKESLIN